MKKGSKRNNSGFDWQLRLYLRGNTPLSAAAVKNLQEITREHLRDNCELEIIDISENIDLAVKDDIVAVPTLVRLSPQPLRRIVGDLTRRDQVLRALDLPLPNAEPPPTAQE